jgi:hypothetical protein
MVIQSERSIYRTSLSAALSLPARATEAPPVQKRAALSDPLGYRTLLARAGQHRRVCRFAENCWTRRCRGQGGWGCLPCMSSFRHQVQGERGGCRAACGGNDRTSGLS